MQLEVLNVDEPSSTEIPPVEEKPIVEEVPTPEPQTQPPDEVKSDKVTIESYERKPNPKLRETDKYEKKTKETNLLKCEYCNKYLTKKALFYTHPRVCTHIPRIEYEKFIEKNPVKQNVITKNKNKIEAVPIKEDPPEPPPSPVNAKPKVQPKPKPEPQPPIQMESTRRVVMVNPRQSALDARIEKRTEHRRKNLFSKII